MTNGIDDDTATPDRRVVTAIVKIAAAAQKCCVRFVPDSIDHRLLRLVQEDASRTLRELGEQVGLSPSAVQRRLRGYRAAGVIAREVAVLDPTVLGATTLAVVLVTLDRESAQHHAEFRSRMRAEPRVQQCYDVAGPWDYVVVLVAESLTECRVLSDRLFLNDENVRRYDTLPVLDPIKTGLAVPPPEP
ncbi:transcriptional regulator [Saccharomonospora cyanea NA-134]|uniref:Transcriptional regulator n=1 Tax=Saccharomonospora cyanea NA-134 TaxID=882082 RepID=H5XEE4_9PSEU|nr:transcriptional regulator [Saccharomonospora cyanea NA-134]